MLTRSPSRKSVNLSIDAELLAQAKALKVNVSRAAEAGISVAVRQEKERRWREENYEAIEQNNRFFEQHGLPFPEYRGF